MTRLFERTTRRRILPALLLACAASATATTGASATAVGVGDYQYLSPLPGSQRVSPWNNVVIRDGRPIDPASVNAGMVSVTGVRSGAHDGALVLSDDGRTLVFRPASPFAAGEQVEVSLAAGIRALDGAPLPAVQFDFTVSGADPALQARAELFEEWAEWAQEQEGAGAPSDPVPEAASWPCTGLPPLYPGVQSTRYGPTDGGHVFLTPFTITNPGHLLILDDLDMPVFYRRLATSAHNLCLQSDGRLTYFDRSPPGKGRPKYFALDSTYAVVDSFAAGNGYVTDSHELELLPDGHALLLSFDPQPVRMDLEVPGGDPDAIVTGLIVQEIDAGKNVVFQWRSWDHFAVTDVTSPTQSLLAPRVDYVHGNSLELDDDGNILLSSRHLSEVTKIDRQTGAVLWRWGMHARHNDFTFVNDTRGFSHQHDVRRLPNGNLTLFDNGNYLSPQYSRALEYALDEEAKTATLVWVHRNSPDVFASFLGSVQRRPDGGTMVAWGGSNTNPRVSDLAPDGAVAWELRMPRRVWTYRAYRFPWRTSLLRTDVTAMDFGEVGTGSSVRRTLTVRNDGRADVTIGCIVTSDPAFEADAPLPVTLPPGGVLGVDVAFRPRAVAPHDAKLYLRVVRDFEVIAQDVVLSGSGVINEPPDCSAAFASEAVLWPPDHRLVPVAIEGVTDPDDDPVSIEIESVMQDEPAGDGPGDGDTCPDAERDGDGVRLRAERWGPGNGRVYRIAFTARDGRGGECRGELPVCVPHDMDEVTPDFAPRCVDDGPAVDALAPCLGRRGAARPEPEAPAAPALALTAAPPAGAKGIVSYTLPARGAARLSVFDPSGRRVATLARGSQAAGAHRLEWNPGGLSPGVYFYRLRAGADAVSRAFVILR